MARVAKNLAKLAIFLFFGNHGANGASEASDMSAVCGAGGSRTLNLKIPPFPRSALHPGPPEGASEASKRGFSFFFVVRGGPRSEMERFQTKLWHRHTV